MIIGVGSDSGSEQRSKAVTSFLFICMAVIRACITNVWINPEPPVFIEWRTRLLLMYNLELAIYKTKGRRKREMGGKIWAPITEWMA